MHFSKNNFLPSYLSVLSRNLSSLKAKYSTVFVVITTDDELLLLALIINAVNAVLGEFIMVLGAFSKSSRCLFDGRGKVLKNSTWVFLVSSGRLRGEWLPLASLE